MSSELLYLPNYHVHPILASASNWDGRYCLYCKTCICR